MAARLGEHQFDIVTGKSLNETKRSSATVKETRIIYTDSGENLMSVLLSRHSLQKDRNIDIYYMYI